MSEEEIAKIMTEYENKKKKIHTKYSPDIKMGTFFNILGLVALGVAIYFGIESGNWTPIFLIAGLECLALNRLLGTMQKKASENLGNVKSARQKVSCLSKKL